MDPTTQQHIASYRGILDQADALIASWFAEAHSSPDPPDPGPLSTMLLTLRRAIDTRCKLDHWENPPKKSPRNLSAPPPPGKEEIPAKADPAAFAPNHSTRKSPAPETRDFGDA